MSHHHPQQQSTPPTQAMELEDKHIISLPSCKELFKVVDFGRGIDDTELKFDIRTFAGSTPVLPPSPLSTPPPNNFDSPFDRAYERGRKMVGASIQSAQRQVSQSKLSVVPYISLAEEENLYRKKAMSYRDTEFSNRRNRLESPFHLKPLSTFKPVLPPRKSSCDPRSFYNKPRLAESANIAASLTQVWKTSSIPPRLPLHSTPTPPSPPLSVAHLSPPSHSTFDPIKTGTSPRHPDHSESSGSSRNNNTHFKPNRCPVCPKSFVRFNDLKRHICIHSGER
ncbi:hypothetical protein JCM3765_003269 [Sporobolomyces pararoseus]